MRGTPVKSLLSASSDGLIKVWDLQRQVCVGSYGDQQMTKITDFCLVGNLGLLLVGSTDKLVRVYEVKVRTEESDKIGDLGDVWLELKGKMLKSDSRTLQLTYDSRQ